jgi:hypothetical protein
MKTFFLFFLSTVRLIGIEPFQLINYNGGYSWAEIPNNVVTFPVRNPNIVNTFPTSVVKTNAEGINIRPGSKMKARFRITGVDAVFRFGGQGTFNNGPTAPHARLYFSAKADVYGNEDGCPNCHWWSQEATGWKALEPGTFEIEATMTEGLWSNSGARVFSPPPINTFSEALSQVRQVGLTFGGGNYFDIGCGLTSGAATFELLDFSVTHPDDVLVITRDGENGAVLSWANSELRLWESTDGNTWFHVVGATSGHRVELAGATRMFKLAR